MAKRKRTNNDLQNITQKTKNWATRTPLKTGNELSFSGKDSSSCGTRRITYLVISLEWRKYLIMITTNGTYLWSLLTQIFRDGQPGHVGDRKAFEVMTSTWPLGTLGSVSSLLAATLYQKRQVLEYWLGDKWYTLFSNRPRLLHVNTICLYIHIYSILWNILKVDITMVGNGYSSLEQ